MNEPKKRTVRPVLRIHQLALIFLVIFLPVTARAAQVAPSRSRAAIDDAKAALTQKDYSGAASLFEKVLSEKPGDPDALIGLERAYLLNRQFKPAASTYKTLLRLQPNNRQALAGLGEAYNQSGEFLKAERVLRRALRLSPLDAEASWALARTYYYEHLYDRAQKLLKRASAKNPSDYRLWESLGEVEVEQGNRVEAQRHLGNALAANPKAERALLLLHEIQGSKSAAPIKLGYHTFAYLLRDGSGNQILTIPQSINLQFGNRWQNALTVSYSRFAFDHGFAGSGPGPRGSGAADQEAGLGARAVGVVSLADSVEFHVSDDWTVFGGAGTVRYLGLAMTRPTYHGGFRFHPTSSMQIDYNFAQRTVTETELSSRLGLTSRGSIGHFTYTFPDSTTLKLGFYQDRFSDSNRMSGGDVVLRHPILEGPIRISVGYQLESLSFSNINLFHGYFSPKRYIANSALLNFAGRKGRFRFDYDFDLGQEGYTRPVILSVTPLKFADQRRSSPRIQLTLRNSYELTPGWSLQASYLFFRSAMSSGTGAYRAQAVLFGLTRHF
ncbi:MAG: tetratricopeptide repeat protein [Candidatus Acidiferrales bacterium]